MSAAAAGLQKKHHIFHIYLYTWQKQQKQPKQNQATYITQYGQNELFILLCYERQNGKKQY